MLNNKQVEDKKKPARKQTPKKYSSLKVIKPLATYAKKKGIEIPYIIKDSKPSFQKIFLALMKKYLGFRKPIIDEGYQKIGDEAGVCKTQTSRFFTIYGKTKLLNKLRDGGGRGRTTIWELNWSFVLNVPSPSTLHSTKNKTSTRANVPLPDDAKLSDLPRKSFNFLIGYELKPLLKRLNFHKNYLQMALQGFGKWCTSLTVSRFRRLCEALKTTRAPTLSKIKNIWAFLRWWWRKVRREARGFFDFVSLREERREAKESWRKAIDTGMPKLKDFGHDLKAYQKALDDWAELVKI